MPASVTFDTGYDSHIGFGRKTNEDHLFQVPMDVGASVVQCKGRLWAVADGMGGHTGGEIASSMACRGLRDYYDKPCIHNAGPVTQPLSRHLVETVIRVDRQVRLKAANHVDLAHMGTTLSCLLLADGHSIIAHVGDSRIYRWRDGHLTCLTTDHTFVQEMIFEGEVDPNKAHLHPLRHLLTNVVGSVEPLSHVDCRIDPFRAGDRFLLCTDGLYHAVQDTDLAAIMGSEAAAGTMARDLVAAALKEKTKDNVTALVVRLRKNG